MSVSLLAVSQLSKIFEASEMCVYVCVGVYLFCFVFKYAKHSSLYRKKGLYSL